MSKFISMLLLALSASIGLAQEADTPAPNDERSGSGQLQAIPLKVAKPESDRLAALEVPADVYALSRTDLRDVTIVGAEGGVVPFEIERVREELPATRETTHALVIESAEELADGKLMLIVAVPKREDVSRPTLTGLRFETPLRDFERQVKIEEARADEEWNLLVENARVFDYSRFADVREVQIEIPASTSERFRLTITQAFDEQESAWREWVRIGGGGEAEITEMQRLLVERRPFRVDRVLGVAVQSIIESGVTQNKPVEVEALQVTRDDTKRVTALSFSTHRQPIHQLILQTQTRQLRRQVEVQIRENETQPWKSMTTGVIQRVTLGERQRDQLAITFPETRAKHWRWLIHDDSQAALSEPEVKASGPMDRIVFLAEQGSEKFELRYGGVRAMETQTSRDLMRTVRSEARRDEFGVLVPVELGEVRALPLMAEDEESFKIRGWVLILAIVLMLIVLAVGIYAAMNRVDQQELEMK